jgi:hypothetical protein
LKDKLGFAVKPLDQPLERQDQGDEVDEESEEGFEE